MPVSREAAQGARASICVHGCVQDIITGCQIMMAQITRGSLPASNMQGLYCSSVGQHVIMREYYGQAAGVLVSM